VLSWLPVTMRLPAEENATVMTLPKRHGSGKCTCEAGCQTRRLTIHIRSAVRGAGSQLFCG
jgi:hypothetical protein